MTTEAETIADLATKAAGASIVASVAAREFLIVPSSATYEEITDPHGLKPAPAYARQRVTLETRDALVDYVSRYKTDDTLLFAEIATSSIVAIVDYHPAMLDDKGAAMDILGGTCAHRATLKLPFSEEWKLWTNIDGRLMPQLEFARFLEENGADVHAPSGAELLEVCRDLQGRRKVNFTRAVRTASDNESFEFTDESEARTKGGIELPTRFLLKIPVYFGEADTEIYAFLRWKIAPEEGGLALGIALNRKEHVRQAVFKQIAFDVAERTGRPVVFGKPE